MDEEAKRYFETLAASFLRELTARFDQIDARLDRMELSMAQQADEIEECTRWMEQH